MGADGGIRINKVSDIKKNWKSIKDRLMALLERDVKNAESYEVEWFESALNKSKLLPENIDDLSGQDIVSMFSFLSSCDCPYLYEDLIITGDGDNVGSEMRTLSAALSGVYIETWT